MSVFRLHYVYCYSKKITDIMGKDYGFFDVRWPSERGRTDDRREDEFFYKNMKLKMNF